MEGHKLTAFIFSFSKKWASLYKKRFNVDTEAWFMSSEISKTKLEVDISDSSSHFDDFTCICQTTSKHCILQAFEKEKEK